MADRYDWILFDLDGTLWDHRTASARAVEVLCDRYGLPTERMVPAFHEANEAVWRELEAGRIDFDRLRVLRFERILAALGIQGWEAGELSDFYLSHYLDEPSWLPNAHETVRAAARCARLAVLTNAPHRTQDAKIRHMGPEAACFEAIVCADDVHTLKPAREFFVRGLELLGAKASSRILMIGDSWEGDIMPPRALGWDVAWISHGQEAPETPAGVRIFEDLAPLLTFLGRQTARDAFCGINR